MDDFNPQNIDEWLARIVILESCERLPLDASEIKELISEPNVVALVDKVIEQLWDEGFLKSETHNGKRVCRATPNGLAWRHKETEKLFSQEEVLESPAERPRFQVQSGERQELRQRVEQVLGRVYDRHNRENIPQSDARDSEQKDVASHESRCAELIREIALHGAGERAPFLNALKQYVLLCILGWSSEIDKDDYLLLRRQSESKLDALLIRSHRLGNSSFSKAGIALLDDSVWVEARPGNPNDQPLWVNRVATRAVSCNDLNAIFNSLDAVAKSNKAAWRAVKQSWQKTYPRSAIKSLIWAIPPANKSAKKSERRLPVFYYKLMEVRFASLADSQGKTVRITWHQVQFLLAYVNKKTGRPIPAISAKRALERAEIKSCKPSLRVRQLFSSLRNQINDWMAEYPERRSVALENLSKKLFTSMPDGSRKLTFALLPAKSSDAPRRLKSKSKEK